MCFYCIFVHWQWFSYKLFAVYLKELEFAIRQIRVHELNKNDMKLELASCHESTSGDNFHFECWVITGLQGKPWVGLCNFGKLLGKILKVGCRSALLQSNHSNVSVPLVLCSYVWVNRLSNLWEGFCRHGLGEYYVKKGNYWSVVIKMCIVWAL